MFLLTGIPPLYYEERISVAGKSVSYCFYMMTWVIRKQKNIIDKKNKIYIIPYVIQFLELKI